MREMREVREACNTPNFLSIFGESFIHVPMECFLSRIETVLRRKGAAFFSSLRNGKYKCVDVEYFVVEVYFSFIGNYPFFLKVCWT